MCSSVHHFIKKKFFFLLFIFLILFLAVLGLCCCSGFFWLKGSGAGGTYSLVARCGLLIAVASLVVEYGALGMWV